MNWHFSFHLLNIINSVFELLTDLPQAQPFIQEATLN